MSMACEEECQWKVRPKAAQSRSSVPGKAPRPILLSTSSIAGSSLTCLTGERFNPRKKLKSLAAIEIRVGIDDAFVCRGYFRERCFDRSCIAAFAKVICVRLPTNELDITRAIENGQENSMCDSQSLVQITRLERTFRKLDCIVPVFGNTFERAQGSGTTTRTRGFSKGYEFPRNRIDDVDDQHSCQDQQDDDKHFGQIGI